MKTEIAFIIVWVLCILFNIITIIIEGLTLTHILISIVGFMMIVSYSLDIRKKIYKKRKKQMSQNIKGDLN